MVECGGRGIFLLGGGCLGGLDTRTWEPIGVMAVVSEGIEEDMVEEIW